MIFTTLVIDNFGVYRGENRFDLRPRVNDEQLRPIILFGGKNGSGKTTILEAIRLCLYGRSALGNRVRMRDYRTYISQRLHRDYSDRRAQQASIQLVFEHTHGGVRSVYNAVRSWKMNGKTLDESVSIFRNGEVLQEIPAEHWDDFLRDLIPPGVADLFFFDGEQIQALANDSTEAEALADAIRGLLNLDIVERLQSDLSTYLRKQKRKDATALQGNAEQIDSQLERVQEHIVELKQDRASLISKLDYAEKKIEDSRQALLQEGAGFIERRDAILQRRDQIDTETEQISLRIRDLAAELLPFALVPAWNQKLRERLVLENKAKRDGLARAALELKAGEVVTKLSSADFRSRHVSEMDDETWGRIVSEIQSALRVEKIEDELEIRHNISDQTHFNLQRWILRANDEIPAELHELAIHLEKLETERNTLEQALKRSPDASVAAPLLSEFQKWSNEQGSLNEQIDSIDLEIHGLKLQEAELDRDSKRAWKELAQASDLDLRVERAAKAQVILDQYLEHITTVKVAELQDQFSAYYQSLARKKNFISQAKIDPQTFQVTLYGENQVVIPKAELSAGEKQLYAMALLWALRSVSGRALPIIMDTPMGRLDTDHRSALLRNFFPVAAHQVIVLSTDTEIDMVAYQQIQDDVSHAYRLEFSEQYGCTQAADGYFGQLELELVI